MNQTDAFLKAMEAVWEAPMPPRIQDRAKRALLDYLGVTLAGAKSLADKRQAYLKAADPGPGPFNVIGTGLRLDLKEAVFLNGLHGHALDLDDGVNEGIIHLGSPLFSLLLPLAEKHAIDYPRFLKAVLVGYEAGFTLASAIQPCHKALGYHATATCGVLSSTLAAAYLLDLAPELRKNALATASVSASGVLKVLDEGSELKPYNVAKAALLGLLSLEMAQAGFRGPLDPLGGQRGFLKMMTGRDDVALGPAVRDGVYALERSYTKPYAACRYCHPAIEAAILLREEWGLIADEIDQVQVKTYYWAVNHHDHTYIPSGASAKMSIPYSVALGLIRGRAGLEEYEAPYIQDPELLALTSRVRVLADSQMTDLFPVKTVAEVSLNTVGGEHFSKRVDLPKGEPGNPLSEEAFADRFRDLLRYSGKSAPEAHSLMTLVQTLDGNMAPLFDQLGHLEEV